MSPCPPFAYGANQAHGNAITFGKSLARTVSIRLGNYISNLGFTKFCIAVILPFKRNIRQSSWVVITTPHPLGKHPSPVPITNRFASFHHWTTTGRSMSLSVICILLCRSPIQVVRGIICYVAIAVRTVRLIIWLRPIECLANKPVNLARYPTFTSAQNMSQIASPLARWRKYASSILALPIGDAAANATQARNFVVGRGLNSFPLLLHVLNMFYMAYNVKLLFWRSV